MKISLNDVFDYIAHASRNDLRDIVNEVYKYYFDVEHWEALKDGE